MFDRANSSPERKARVSAVPTTMETEEGSSFSAFSVASPGGTFRMADASPNTCMMFICSLTSRLGGT